MQIKSIDSKHICNFYAVLIIATWFFLPLYCGTKEEKDKNDEKELKESTRMTVGQVKTEKMSILF